MTQGSLRDTFHLRIFRRMSCRLSLDPQDGLPADINLVYDRIDAGLENISAQVLERTRMELQK